MRPAAQSVQSIFAAVEVLFAQPYDRIAALGPQPIWVAEVASVEQGGDKAAWIRDMLTTTAFPRLEAVVWFDENKGADWRIRSTDSAVQAFREHLDRPLLASH